MKQILSLLIVAALVGISLDSQAADKNKKKKAAAPKSHPTGYNDTPFIPGQKWRVHDDARVRPPVIKAGQTFSDGAGAPSDATVLFDGRNLKKWVNSKDDSAPKWKIENGYMEVVGGSGSIKTKEKFGDVQLHLEFATPVKVDGASQGRGNSGVYFNGMYEVQILDSYQNKSYADGQVGALYGQKPPRFNAARGPGEWQTYDIVFEGPRWDAEKRLIKKAHVTVIHNGVVLHNRQPLIGTTGHKRVGNYNRVHDPEVFIQLQDHRNPTRFRNIWVRSLGEYDALDKK
jgi:hypothetical protein